MQSLKDPIAKMQFHLPIESAMNLTLLTILTTLLLSFLIYKTLKLAYNIHLARSTGIPYTITPMHELESWAFITNYILRWLLAGYLMRGNGWPHCVRFMVKDWMYEDKGRAHSEYGDVFLVVSPAGLVCYLGTTDLAMQVCRERRGYVKPADKMRLMEPFGPSIVTTNGDLWRAHLRITLPSFGEGVHRLVWAETLRQGKMLTDTWLTSTEPRSLQDNIYALTCNVMSCVAFGKTADWTPTGCRSSSSAAPAPSRKVESDSSHTMSLAEAVVRFIPNLGLILLTPSWLLRWVSHGVWVAYVEFEQYVDELLASERAKLAKELSPGSSASEVTSSGNGKAAHMNLLAAVVRSNAVKEEGKVQLLDEEVKGNVFIFLLAGYDTTANTIIYTTLVLALYDDIQDQAIAEVRRVYVEAAAAGHTELSYEEDLPKFRYLLALMYETMRIFPIVLPITRKSTPSAPALFNPSTGQKHRLPLGSLTVVNNTAIHYNPAYWPHPHIVEPKRWLTSSPNTYDPLSPSKAHEEEIASGSAIIPGHIRGTFMTFNEGPRACLGKRFSQVEFLAFFAVLLERGRAGLPERNMLGMDKAAFERMLRLRGGGAPVTLVPPVDVQVEFRGH
ncbi:cytochrome P450 [Aspergillus pseudoustus]|uniref:Cytochrome P450 n=1 Tax=Aspergillus pseudoustus TaxID=1810923 RepID=A0ABR4J254_9EURO